MPKNTNPDMSAPPLSSLAKPETDSSNEKNNLLYSPWIWISLAVFANLLWGSAFPSVKRGYQLFQIASSDTPSILLFAGVRFMLSGIIAYFLNSLLCRRWMTLPLRTLPKVMAFGWFNTTLCYTCFYLGVAHSSGTKSSIINGSNAFIAVIIAHLFGQGDRLNAKKIWAIILGFAGIIILNIGQGQGFTWDFTWLGEGMMLATATVSAMANFLSKRLAQSVYPGMLTAVQLSFGGATLALIGLLSGGRLIWPSDAPVAATLNLLFLALISCVAFSIWTRLLKIHSLSKVSIFKTLIPIFGALGSWLFLHENFLTWQKLLSLALIVLSIALINFQRRSPKTLSRAN